MTRASSRKFGTFARDRDSYMTRIFTVLLFAIFVVTLLMALLISTNVYKGLNGENALVDKERLSLSLLTNTVKAYDRADAVAKATVTEDGVELEQLEGLTKGKVTAGSNDAKKSADNYDEEVDAKSILQGPALVLQEVLPTGTYEMRIYRYNNTIRQEYVLASAPYNPENADVIVESTQFDFTYEHGMLTIETDVGATCIAMNCAGGGAL